MISVTAYPVLPGLGQLLVVLKGNNVNWIEEVKPIELLIEAPMTQLMDTDDKFTIDDVASLMVKGAPQFFAMLKSKENERLAEEHRKRIQENLPSKEWWPKVKYEFHVFLCTDDKKYENLRKKLADSGGTTSATILSTISAAIGSSLGFEAGAITGLVAVCIYGLIKIGKEAYCDIAHSN